MLRDEWVFAVGQPGEGSVRRQDNNLLLMRDITANEALIDHIGHETFYFLHRRVQACYFGGTMKHLDVQPCGLVQEKPAARRELTINRIQHR